MLRDFTYIDDIVKGIVRILNNPPVENEEGVRYKVYNIGNNKPATTIEEGLAKFAEWFLEYYAD